MYCYNHYRVQNTHYDTCPERNLGKKNQEKKKEKNVFINNLSRAWHLRSQCVYDWEGICALLLFFFLWFLFFYHCFYIQKLWVWMRLGWPQSSPPPQHPPIFFGSDDSESSFLLLFYFTSRADRVWALVHGPRWSSSGWKQLSLDIIGWHWLWADYHGAVFVAIQRGDT